MKRDIKIDMKKKARVVAGIVNLLRDDADHLKSDADDFDVICLEESIKDAKRTAQMLTDTVTEMEYLLYLFNANEYR